MHPKLSRPDVPRPHGRDALSADIADELLELLTEAATEIYNLSDNKNPVLARLRAMRDRVASADLCP